ncbi:hypothetical protein Bbelb_007790 [Branchiostoma belcheri]|nr:hypothetical protein Bbelb_007790 [Branchiostoma belcheri]
MKRGFRRDKRTTTGKTSPGATHTDLSGPGSPWSRRNTEKGPDQYSREQASGHGFNSRATGSLVVLGYPYELDNVGIIPERLMLDKRLWARGVAGQGVFTLHLSPSAVRRAVRRFVGWRADGSKCAWRRRKNQNNAVPRGQKSKHPKAGQCAICTEPGRTKGEGRGACDLSHRYYDSKVDPPCSRAAQITAAVQTAPKESRPLLWNAVPAIAEPVLRKEISSCSRRTFLVEAAYFFTQAKQVRPTPAPQVSRLYVARCNHFRIQLRAAPWDTPTAEAPCLQLALAVLSGRCLSGGRRRYVP